MKICPFMGGSNCVECDCALWVSNRCSITLLEFIGFSLEDIKQNIDDITRRR